MYGGIYARNALAEMLYKQNCKHRKPSFALLPYLSMKFIPNDRIRYLLRSAQHQFTKGVCPNCQKGEYKTIKRKYLVTRLVQCQNCQLLYRIPNDPIPFNNDFYQSTYQEYDGITTYLPDPEELNVMISSNFDNTAKNVNHILPVLKSLIPEFDKIRMVDYGASWGYLSYLFQKQGMNIQSYEISKPRADYGNKYLGLDIKTKITELRTDNNVFFNSHVIEHIPSIHEMIENAKKLTAGSSTSYFIAYSPNGSFERMEQEPRLYHANWGLVHPNFISDLFYKKVFVDFPYCMDSSPYDFKFIDKWDKKSQVIGEMKGFELLIIVKLK